MTKEKLTGVIHELGTLTKAQAKQTAEHVLESIKSELVQEGRCQLPGIGTITVRTLAARTIDSPVTGKVDVPERKTAKLAVCGELKRALNG